MNISMKLVYQYMAIFFNFQTTSYHLHPLQVENCDSNSRLVVNEDDNGKYSGKIYLTQYSEENGLKVKGRYVPVAAILDFL